MPLAVDATVGGPNANSFQTVAEIDNYFLGRVPSSVAAQWNALSATDKIAAAVMSTTWITALVHWTSFPVSAAQALPWPQYGQVKRSGIAMVPLDIIPQELKNCQAEIALYLAQEDRIADFDPIKFGINKLKVGSIDLEFREKIPVQDQPPVIPSTLWDLLVPSWVDYIEDGSSGTREVGRA
jgi:hypothetical protein